MATGSGLQLTTDGLVLSCQRATHILRDGSVVVGAAYGLLKRSEANSLVRRLRNHDDPGSSAPDTPWAAVALDDHGGIVAAAATMLSSGMFYSVEEQHGVRSLILATDPGEVISAKQAKSTLDPYFIRDFAILNTTAEQTPYAGIVRLPSGRTLRWRPDGSEPTITAWVGPGCWPEPDLHGTRAVLEYRETFDRVVGELIPRAGELTTQISGGLDSTFVAATLARRAGTKQSILALNHRPHPSAVLAPAGNWDPDDSSAARSLLHYYPTNLNIRSVINDELIQPLDAAAVASSRSWLPTFNPGNQVWLNATLQSATDNRATALFVGSGGNSAFSPKAPYAFWFHTRRGQIQQATASIGRESGRGRPRHRIWKTQVLSPLRPALVAQPRRFTQYLRDNGLAQHIRLHDRQTSFNRAQHLAWLEGDTNSLAAAANPTLGSGTLMVDPFRARSILELAARISPATWVQGPADRGFARAVGADRVPDQIRLRSRRGGQAWDSWFVVHQQRARYEQEVEEMAATPIISEIVDMDVFARLVANLPWGCAYGRGPRNLLGIHRLMSLAGFVRMTEQRLLN